MSLVEPPYNGTVYLQTDHPHYPLLQIPVQLLVDREPVVPVPVQSEGAITIQVFYQPGCPECETVRREIEPMLNAAFPGSFRLEWLDVTEPTHISYLLRVQEMLNVQDSDPVSALVNGQV